MTIDNRQDIRSDDNRKHNDMDTAYLNRNPKKESGSMGSEKQHENADNKRASAHDFKPENLKDNGSKTGKTSHEREAVEGLESEKIRERGRTGGNQNSNRQSGDSTRKDDEGAKR